MINRTRSLFWIGRALHSGRSVFELTEASQPSSKIHSASEEFSGGMMPTFCKARMCQPRCVEGITSTLPALKQAVTGKHERMLFETLFNIKGSLI
jgi:hypothetical protein